MRKIVELSNQENPNCLLNIDNLGFWSSMNVNFAHCATCSERVTTSEVHRLRINDIWVDCWNTKAFQAILKLNVKWKYISIKLNHPNEWTILRHKWVSVNAIYIIFIRTTSFGSMSWTASLIHSSRSGLSIWHVMVPEATKTSEMI